MKQEVGQYWAHAIRDLEAHPKINARMDRARKTIIDCLRSAVKINLPKNGEIYRKATDVPTQDELDSVIPPGSITAYQYDWDKKPDAEGTDKAPRRITLMLDYAEDKNLLVLFSVYYVTTHKRWTFSHMMLYLDLPLRLDGVGGSFRNLVTDEYVNSNLPETRQLIREFSTDLSIFIQFCHAVRAGASVEEERESSFVKLQRLRKAKIPNDSYYVLKLPHSRSGKSGEGTHESPRLHFRRAHIRKLSGGNLTWVRSCLVGDAEKGIIHKDYKVERQQ